MATDRGQGGEMTEEDQKLNCLLIFKKDMVSFHILLELIGV